MDITDPAGPKPKKSRVEAISSLKSPTADPIATFVPSVLTKLLKKSPSCVSATPDEIPAINPISLRVKGADAGNT